ncbi:MAG: hypothetical protein LBG50_04685 [Clostridiales Family XIII bacterium]|jgi:hypothetical protein|nr:hypothetical protein [Clostridiales Family XIII bacterium]
MSFNNNAMGAPRENENMTNPDTGVDGGGNNAKKLRHPIVAHALYVTKSGIKGVIIGAIIACLVLTILDTIFNRTGVTDDNGAPFTLAKYMWAIIGQFSSIFMFVYGISMPFEMKNRMSFGITRGQVSLGLLLSSVMFAVFFLIINVTYAAFTGSISALSPASMFLFYILYWLYGWLVAIGFQFRHICFLFPFASIGAAIAIFGATMVAAPYVQNIDNIYNSFVINENGYAATTPMLADAIGIIILLAEIILLAAALLFLSKKVPFKC